MKKILCLLLALVTVLTVTGCAVKIDEPETGEVNVYVLSGPTGIGAVNLRAKSEESKSLNKYNFSMVAANDEIIAAVSNGSADIAAVATNLAATLYNRTNGGVTVLAVNTTSVLSILTNGTEINSVSELRGKTIYTPGQGANPEYILRYILKGNGIDPDKDVDIQFVADGSELPTVWAKEENKDAVIMAPQPVATNILMKYTEAKKALDMGEEWSKISGDSSLFMGCVIVRNEFLKANPGVVKTFLKEYEESVNSAVADAAATGTLCEKYGIIPKAAIATKAIPACGLEFIAGEDMKKGLSGYLKVMFDANPKSVGGALPEDSFYYAG